MAEEPSDLLKILIVSLVASYLSFTKSKEQNLKFFINRLIEGCFCGYISFLICLYFLKEYQISLAVCGIGAFFGVKIFDFIRFGAEKFLNKKINGGDDEF